MFCHHSSVLYPFTEGVQQVRLLAQTRTLSAFFPIRQDFLQISFGALQRLNVGFDSFELSLGELVHTVTGGPSGITNL